MGAQQQYEDVAFFGEDWQVVIIRAGKSLNGYTFTEDVLKASLELFEGLPVRLFERTLSHPRFSGQEVLVANIIGKIENVSYEDGAVVGRLVFLETVEPWIKERVEELAANKLVGLSIVWKGDIVGGAVTEISSVLACDVVARPAAGGAFVRPVFEDGQVVFDNDNKEVEMSNNADYVRAVAFAVGKKLDVEDASVSKILARVADGVLSFEDAKELLELAAKERAAREEAEKAKAEAEAAKAEAAKLKAKPAPVKAGTPQSGDEFLRRYEAALVRLLDPENPDVKDAPELFGLRHAAAVWEKRRFDAGIEFSVEKLWKPEQLRQEDVLTSTWPGVMSSAMNRTLEREYDRIPWGEDVVITMTDNFVDFRPRNHVRLGLIQDLPQVNPETADYQELAAPTDETVTYSIDEYGGILTITHRTIINDDIGAVRQMVRGLARAARRTHAKHAWSFILSNPNYTVDGFPLFDAANHANDLSGTLTFDAAGFGAILNAVNALATQMDRDSREHLGMPMSFALIVPGALWHIAEQWRVGTEYEQAKPNIWRPMISRVVRIPDALSPAANIWYVARTDGVANILAAGYLFGRRRPQIQLANNINASWELLSDRLKYRVRFYFNFVIDDFRAIVRMTGV